MVIQPSDRIADVLARDERMVEVLASLAPAFARLRNPAMRKVMARLATVEHAARVARIEPAWLVERLNEALDGFSANAGGGSETTTGGATTSPGDSNERAEMANETMPAALAAVPTERIVDADVREALHRGEEPFRQIMAAKSTVPEGGVLRVRAIFEPAPLYAVLAKQGFAHWTERLADDDWRVWFYRSDEARAPDAPGTVTKDAPGIEGDDVVVLDVRGLEPPEPMVRTLEALEALPPGGTLVQLNVRVPHFLLPQLEARGFAWEVFEQEEDLVRVVVRRG